MNDSFINALNIQSAAQEWMNVTVENMTNLYTPGYKEKNVNFKTFLDSVYNEGYLKNMGQGKAVPGTSSENLFLEGKGFFVLRKDDGSTAYTRLGDFKFDGEGVYKAKDGSKVQGYILNDKGEIMSGVKKLTDAEFEQTLASGGAMSVPTTEIKMWIDPDNGKFLGKYDEWEIKEDGIIYGKIKGGKESKTPLYKIATMNFHNPQQLYEIKDGQWIETAESGKPVAGKGEIRSGLLELSNIDFKGNITAYKEAKMQLNMANKLISSYKQLLDEALDLLQ
ncbi:flagellar hook basal-body protein [bacterium]|nr:flagellar hook basal-body protein [bacterium]